MHQGGHRQHSSASLWYLVFFYSNQYCFPSRVNLPVQRNMGSSTNSFLRPVAGVVSRSPTETWEGHPVPLGHSDFIFSDSDISESVFQFITGFLQAFSLNFFFSALIGVGSDFVFWGLSCIQRHCTTHLRPPCHHGTSADASSLNCAALNLFSHFSTSLSLQRWGGMR